MITVSISLIADTNMEPGVTVALHSLLSHLSEDAFADIYLFLYGWNKRKIGRLRFNLQAFEGKFRIRTLNDIPFRLGSGTGMHHCKLMRLILYAPELVPAEKLLCLDADVLVLADVSKLFEIRLGDKTAAVVSEETAKNCWGKDWDVLHKVGVKEDAPFFNTGVVLFNTAQYRKEGIKDKCMQFLEKHHQETFTEDQAVLNIMLEDRITLLPAKYHQLYFPTVKREAFKKGEEVVCHFLGSPKPWDHFGFLFNKNAALFHSYVRENNLKMPDWKETLHPNRISRTVRIRRSYAVILYRLLKKLL